MVESVVRRGDHFVWVIPTSTLCPKKHTWRSPYFTFDDRAWGLEMKSQYVYAEHKTWYILTLSSVWDLDPRDFVRLGFKAGEIKMMRKAMPVAHDRRFIARIVSADETTQARWKQLAPKGELTVICKIETHGTRERNRKARYATQDGFASKTFEKLLLDLGQMYLSGQNSDVVLRVNMKEFKAHRNILAARSPVFDAMFTHNMREKVSGVVTIKDNDSDTFSDFLLYLYTGRLPEMTPENVQKLFVTADKYQVAALKDECVSFMISNTTEETVGDFLNLALRHHEPELIAAARYVLSLQEKKIYTGLY